MRKRLSFDALALVCAGLFAGALACRQRAEPPESAAVSPPGGTSAPAPASAASEAAAPPEFQKLVGQWMRNDWDYMIWIKGVAADGKMDASYLNPRPIHVSRAEARREEGTLKLLVEMTDRNYPGSYYTLAYDPGSDTLYGIYHQLVQNQRFEVAFSRFDENPAGKGAR